LYARFGWPVDEARTFAEEIAARVARIKPYDRNLVYFSPLCQGHDVTEALDPEELSERDYIHEQQSSEPACNECGEPAPREAVFDPCWQMERTNVTKDGGRSMDEVLTIKCPACR
jgi:hypothetical protein